MIGSAFNISLSGLRLNQTSLASTANNVANVTTSSKVGEEGFTPTQVTGKSLGKTGGVAAQVQAKDPASTPVYNPTNTKANADGVVNMPNVELSTEMVTMLQDENFHSLNLKAMQTADDMTKDLIDSLKK